MRFIKNNILILFSILCASCISHKDDYYYISLQNAEGIEVKKVQVPDNSNIHVEKPIAVEYFLRRVNYTIRFEIDQRGYLPNIIVNAFSSETDVNIQVKAVKFRKMKNSDKNKCNPSYIENEDYSFKFVLINCIQTESENVRYISFDIIKNERVIGSEDIPFEVIRNGYFRVLDGI
jgi:hypothetical protein